MGRTLLLAALVVSAAPARTETLTSPDGRVVATLTAGDEARYALAVDGVAVLEPAPLGLALADGRVLGRGRVERVERREIDETIPTPFGERASVRSRCSELALVLADGATLRARVYDDGLALRWETALSGRIQVNDESFNVAFPEEPRAFMLRGQGAHHGYEGIWAHAPISSLAAGVEPQTALLPLVFDPPVGPKLALLQVDVNDYPAMYLGYRPSHPRQLSAVFPRRALAEGPGGFREFDLVVTQRAADIARPRGRAASRGGPS
jgi:alpha-glucosidase